MTATESKSRKHRVRKVLAVLALRKVPFWQRSRFRRVCRLAAFPAYGYVGIFLVLLALEDSFLYRPVPAWHDWSAPPAGLTVEDVFFTTPDGNRVHAWWAPPPGWTPADGAVLYAHGKGGNLSSRGEKLLHWQKALKTAVLIFDYPGYGKSEGHPSEAGCYAAGNAAYDWLLQKGVRQQDVILYGGSLGGAIATELAVERPGRALVVVSTFTSFADMAERKFPYFPGRWFVKTRMNTIDKIDKVRCPVFIAHGTADQLIPIAQGERLFAAAAEPKDFVPMEGVSHTETARDDVLAELRSFLQRHAATR
jgi:uncharacterized protein